ncbi:MAG: endolytic transglycosylase MltG [Actinobacteria bacterium]|nr:endolytic transglycosylase MltG [Actinomycetota bacterium]
MRSDRGQGFRNLVGAGLFILLFTLGLRAIAPGPAPAPDFDGRDRGTEVVVHIESGMSGSEIGALLAENEVVKSSLAYFRAAVSNPDSERIAPGEHRIETRIPAREAIAQLLDPDRIVNLVRIRDGARLNEIKDELIKAGFKKGEITSAFSSAKAPAPFNSKSIEGFLYPAFYSYPKQTSVKSALDAMLEKFSFMTKEVNWRYQDFSAEELLTIASLVEGEGTPDVFGKIARVVYNRLEKGMPLQFDSTVHYILDSRGEISLSLKDTEVRSPYNTYLYRGLPPGPIGSPTIKAITATLNPEPGDWLYFVTVLPGETKFTSSYDEFLSFKLEYKRNYANGKFD